MFDPHNMLDWDGKTASQLQDMSNGWNLNKYEEVEESVVPDKPCSVFHLLW